jgi:F-type H+-transporting ATPase subunit epsilon
MHVAIHSLKKTLFEGEAKAVNVKTTAGEITVMDHHRPLIAMLAKGPMRVTDANGQNHFFEIESGFLEISVENRVKLLVDGAKGEGVN